MQMSTAFINRHIVCKKCEVILLSCSTWIVPQLQYAFPEGLEKVELVQRAVVGEVVFLRPVITEGRMQELNPVLY